MVDVAFIQNVLEKTVKERYPQIDTIQVSKSDPDPNWHFNWYYIYLGIKYDNLLKMDDTEQDKLKKDVKRFFHFIIPDTTQNNIQVVFYDPND